MEFVIDDTLHAIENVDITKLGYISTNKHLDFKPIGHWEGRIKRSIRKFPDKTYQYHRLFLTNINQKFYPEQPYLIIIQKEPQQMAYYFYTFIKQYVTVLSTLIPNQDSKPEKTQHTEIDLPFLDITNFPIGKFHVYIYEPKEEYHPEVNLYGYLTQKMALKGIRIINDIAVKETTNGEKIIHKLEKSPINLPYGEYTGIFITNYTEFCQSLLDTQTKAIGIENILTQIVRNTILEDKKLDAFLHPYYRIMNIAEIVQRIIPQLTETFWQHTLHKLIDIELKTISLPSLSDIMQERKNRYGILIEANGINTTKLDTVLTNLHIPLLFGKLIQSDLQWYYLNEAGELFHPDPQLTPAQIGTEIYKIMKRIEQFEKNLK